MEKDDIAKLMEQITTLTQKVLSLQPGAPPALQSPVEDNRGVLLPFPTVQTQSGVASIDGWIRERANAGAASAFVISMAPDGSNLKWQMFGPGASCASISWALDEVRNWMHRIALEANQSKK